MAVATFTKSGTKATTAATLDKRIFGLKVESHELLKQAYTAYLANGRVNSAKTKNRGDVRGGGAKPWRQKGTGRARFGSSRNPIWTGGGVAFGPTGNENYSKKLGVTSKRLAIRQALSLSNTEDRIKVIEALTFDGGKTKAAVNLFNKIDAKDSVLVVVDSKDDQTDRATRNLSNIKLVQATYLNVFDVMNADQLVFTRKALDALSEWLGGANV